MSTRRIAVVEICLEALLAVRHSVFAALCAGGSKAGDPKGEREGDAPSPFSFTPTTPIRRLLPSPSFQPRKPAQTFVVVLQTRAKKYGSKQAPLATRSTSTTRSRKHAKSTVRKEPSVAKTRSVAKAKVTKAPVRVEKTVVLSSNQQVDAFLDRVEKSTTAALVVETLIIDHLSDAATSIFRILERTHFVEELVLNISNQSPTTLLLPQPFAHLAAFETNLPHATIRPFLEKHPHLMLLKIGHCDEKTDCCLKNVSLPYLTDLSCPPKCAAALAPFAPLTRLFATARDQSDAVFDISMLFNLSTNITLSKLTVLHVTFDPCDVLTMSKIAAGAPGLTDLKLEENPYIAKGMMCLIPAWRVEDWVLAMRSLSKLQCLWLKTLIPLSSPAYPDDDLANDWMFRVGRSRRAFMRLVIWSDARQGQGSLLCWSRAYGSSWKKTYEDIVGPTETRMIDEGDFY
ncbi:hypothetical protein OF83DRAFT_1174818 [Amylostereum chailletii]|nr:hypothetical protein OF83DRAFT_1174818 [Amylostereum chailletii]